MLQYLLSSRLIQAGLVFFVLSVSGSLLYSWHVKRTTEKEFAQHQRFLRGLQNQNETRTAADTRDTSGVNFEQGQTPDAPNTSQPTDDTETVLPSDEMAAFMDLADALLPDAFVLEEETPEAVPVSPFGFGPYPEVPTDYTGNVFWEYSEAELAHMKKMMEADAMRIRGISWTEYLKEMELMSRVRIKLWKEGQRFDGMISSDQTGLFYPGEPGVLYVEWQESTRPNGEVIRYMARTIGSGFSNLSIAQIEGREPISDELDIRSMDDGIDPYEFLGLPR